MGARGGREAGEGMLGGLRGLGVGNSSAVPQGLWGPKGRREQWGGGGRHFHQSKC